MKLLPTQESQTSMSIAAGTPEAALRFYEDIAGTTDCFSPHQTQPPISQAQPAGQPLPSLPCSVAMKQLELPSPPPHRHPSPSHPQLHPHCCATDAQPPPQPSSSPVQAPSSQPAGKDAAHASSSHSSYPEAPWQHGQIDLLPIMDLCNH